jgi:hypothetical protein
MPSWGAIRFFEDLACTLQTQLRAVGSW